MAEEINGKNNDFPNLNAGGTPGNKGGGRPKSEVRERCVGSFHERIKVAEEIIDNPESSSTDRLRALDILGKYGGLQQLDHTTDDKPIRDSVNLAGMTLDERLQLIERIREAPKTDKSGE